MPVQRGVQLVFFTQQNASHDGKPLHCWLLEEARRLGLQGGSEYFATQGFGQHHRIHSAHFFELADQPLELVFVVSESEADFFMSFLQQQPISLFYMRVPIEFGFVGTMSELQKRVES